MTLGVALAVLAVLALGFGYLLLFRGRPRLPATTRATTVAAARPRDDVRFTVYRPACVEPERWYELLVYAHRAEGPTEDDGWQPDLSAAVHGEAAKLLGDAAPSYRTATEDAAHPVVRDTQLEFVPEVDGFQFNPPRIVLDWTEALHRAHFRMKADATLVGTTARGQLSIFNGPLLLAQLALVIRVAETAADEAPERSVASPYRRVFASYARTDADVVRRIAEYARAVGDEYLIDLTHIRSGERWEPRIEQLIAQADVFQLFWSWNAIASEYVQREWRYALSLGRPNFVRPVYWEDPLPQAPERGLPPAELRSIHFQRVAFGTSPGRTPPTAAPAAPPPPVEFRDVRLDDAVATYSEDVLRQRPAAAPAPPASFDAHAPRRRPRMHLGALATLVLALGAVGVFTQLSRTGGLPDDAIGNPAEVPPAPPPPPPPPPAVVEPLPAIVVAGFEVPADDPDLSRRADELRAQLAEDWPGESIAAAAGSDPVEVARAEGSRWVVTASLTRAAGEIRIEAFATDITTGETRTARTFTAPADAPASEIVRALTEVLREATAS